MPKVSVNILTKDRAGSLARALESVGEQSFKDYEVVVVNDGSRDETHLTIETFKHLNVVTIIHEKPIGITNSRQEALIKSSGEYVVILDDDDEWLDKDKLKKQVEYFDTHPDVVLVGGGIKSGIEKFRPESDADIRKTMLLHNNFFTSAVMFRKQTAIEAGGFVKDAVDLAEDYDLWLRMGKKGKMYNFQEVFTAYTAPSYNREKFKAFLAKQWRLISQNRANYPYYWLASVIIRLRLMF